VNGFASKLEKFPPSFSLTPGFSPVIGGRTYCETVLTVYLLEAGRETVETVF
jgi:hypothetical protein